MDPVMVLSNHLPAASGALLGTMSGSLEAAPKAETFVGPDQAALEQMLAR